MGGLQTEGFLHLGIRRDEQVQEDSCGYAEAEEDIYYDRELMAA